MQDILLYLFVQSVISYSSCWWCFRDGNFSVSSSELWSCIFPGFPL